MDDRVASHACYVTTAIVLIALYAVVIGLYEACGGLGAAADAIKRWGEASSRVVGR